LSSINTLSDRLTSELLALKNEIYEELRIDPMRLLDPDGRMRKIIDDMGKMNLKPGGTWGKEAAALTSNKCGSCGNFLPELKPVKESIKIWDKFPIRWDTIRNDDFRVS